MSLKSKGINAERELIHFFWENGWSAIRCAGSGSMKYPCPDILAGNNLRKIGIECKSTSIDKQYFTKKEIFELQQFCNIFGAECWVAIRFPKKQWFFISVEDLIENKSSYSINYERAKLRGLELKDMVL